MWQASNRLAECDGIAHGFFTRQGGVSEGIYASLNCGPGSDDNLNHVNENRRRVMEALDASDASLCTLHQIHSDQVICARAPWHDSARPKADAMVSNKPDKALGILTADCGPVLFADPKSRVIGAAHAGWRGAFGGVLENTIAAMEGLGAQREHIIAAIGPCIAQDSYEVGAEFYDHFTSAYALYGTFFKASSHSKKILKQVQDDRYYFDLSGFIEHRLAQSGLQHIEPLAMDTYEDETRFFSYRRTTHKGEADYGRQISVIMLSSHAT